VFLAFRHPHARRPHILLADLAAEPFCSRSAVSRVEREHLRSVCRATAPVAVLSIWQARRLPYNQKMRKEIVILIASAMTFIAIAKIRAIDPNRPSHEHDKAFEHVKCQQCKGNMHTYDVY